MCEWLNGDAGNVSDYGSTLYGKNRHVPIRQSSSVGHLVTLGRLSNHTAAQSEKDSIYDKKIKRTKSLWKFKKADNVLEGMSLWKHRSLVDVSANQGEGISYSRGTPVLDKRMTVTKEISVDSGDENSTIMNGDSQNSKCKSTGKLYGSTALIHGALDSDEDSDQESCIVVDDHRKTDSINKSKLPRTRLAKTNSASPMKVENGFKQYKDHESDMVFESNKLQTFKYNTRIADSWYDSWGERRKK